jgi:hypothetical protein
MANAAMKSHDLPLAFEVFMVILTINQPGAKGDDPISSACGP